MSCCIFLRRPTLPRLCYKQLVDDESNEPAVKVIVGKERREFMVDPFVLDKYPFRVLLEMVRKERKGDWEFRKKDVIFVDVDSILFEHMLWLVCNDRSKSAFSMVQLNLRDIIEFYSSDN
jgi:Auxin responsive protein